MSISTVVTRGYGSGASIAFVTTRGYTIRIPTPGPGTILHSICSTLGTIGIPRSTAVLRPGSGGPGVLPRP